MRLSIAQLLEKQLKGNHIASEDGKSGIVIAVLQEFDGEEGIFRLKLNTGYEIEEILVYTDAVLEIN